MGSVKNFRELDKKSKREITLFTALIHAILCGIPATNEQTTESEGFTEPASQDNQPIADLKSVFCSSVRSRSSSFFSAGVMSIGLIFCFQYSFMFTSMYEAFAPLPE